MIINFYSKNIKFATLELNPDDTKKMTPCQMTLLTLDQELIDNFFERFSGLRGSKGYSIHDFKKSLTGKIRVVDIISALKQFKRYERSYLEFTTEIIGLETVPEGEKEILPKGAVW